MDTDHLIIGGGAAGVFAALTASKCGKRCIILEPNEQIGRKLRITGKGRCNLTNNCTQSEFMEHIPRNNSFLYSSIARCTPQDIMNYFSNLGVPLKTERGNRVFPVSNKAQDIVHALVSELKKKKVPVIRARVKNLCIENGCCIGAKTTDGEIYRATTTLLATGGISYPATGSTGDGFRMAEKVGHTIISPVPSLVPIETEEIWCRDAMGLSLKNVSLKLYNKNKCIYESLGEMLFTHFGVSGPLVLRASAHILDDSPENYYLKIDLKPGLNIEQLDKRLQRDFSEMPNKAIGTILRGLLPAKLIPVILSLIELPPETKVHDITRVQRQVLANQIKNLTLNIKSFRPVEEAIITRGGICVKEINAKTMESKLVPNLYFAGEIIDVDGYTGGFNLQIAFSTAFSAGTAMALKNI